MLEQCSLRHHRDVGMGEQQHESCAEDDQQRFHGVGDVRGLGDEHRGDDDQAIDGMSEPLGAVKDARLVVSQR